MVCSEQIWINVDFPLPVKSGKLRLQKLIVNIAPFEHRAQGCSQ